LDTDLAGTNALVIGVGRRAGIGFATCSSSTTRRSPQPFMGSPVKASEATLPPWTSD
jgi:hypothetical protein